jgi:PIN domain nuclease of toxin-antitoxin system
MGCQPVIVLDTHALVWWLAGPEQLSPRALRAIKTAAANSEVAISAVSVFEIATLVRRGRLELGIDADRWFAALRSLPELIVEPISAEIAWAAGGLDARLPGDPADRIITATALALDAKLATPDEKLRAAANIQTVW